MHVQRGFLLLMTLATAAVSALEQDVARADELGASAAQTSASIPDFSGIWAHPYWPGFEPPQSGPGPVTNKSRLRRGRQSGVSNPFQLVGDYTNPILKPWAAEIVKRRGEIELSGMAAPTPLNQCWPGGVPFIFFSPGMQMLQQQEKITIFHGDQFRQVRLNQPRSTPVTPSWHGDAVGHYEGDTLVIDTVGVKIGPFAMVDMYGTPRTEALHVVERYQLLDYEVAKEALERNAKENFRFPPGVIPLDIEPNYRGKHLQLQFTVEDEGAFTMPWSATITYGRGVGARAEYVCAENPHDYFTGTDAAVPRADKPDF